MDGAVTQVPESVIVRRPALGAVVDTFRGLLHLPPRHQQGFTPRGEHTLVETIIDHDQSGIGPITISTDARRLFAYAVRYEDGTCALMTLVGHSVCDTFKDRSTPSALRSILYATYAHGTIVRHTLLNVVTPAVLDDSLERYAVLNARTHLHQLIFDASEFESIAIPALSLSKVILRGWPKHGTQLPSCTFQTMMGDTLWMRLAWGKSYQDSSLFRLV